MDFTLKDIFTKKKTKWFWITNIILLMLCYGFELFNNCIGIDDEAIKVYLYSDNGLRSIGRFGLNIINLIFNVDQHLPFFYLFIALGLLCVFMYLTTNMFSIISEKDFSVKTELVFCAVFVVMPFFSSKLIFTMNILQIGIVYVLIPITAYFALKFIKNSKSIIFAAASVIINVFLFYNDESFIIVFGLIVMYCLLIDKERRDFKAVILCLIKLAVIVLSTVLLWYLIKKLYFFVNGTSEGNYLAGYMAYNGENFAECLYSVIKKIFVPTDLNSVCRLAATTCLLFGCIKRCRDEKTSAPIIIFISMIILLYSMYLFTLNAYLHLRVLIYFSCFYGICMAELYMLINDKKPAFKAAFNILLVFIIYYNAKTTNMIFYADYLKCQLDTTVAHQIYYDLKKETYGYDTKPIVFLGKIDSYDLPYNIPVSFGSFISASPRLHRFFTELGIKIHIPTNENDYLKYSMDMESFPKDGYILELDSNIIVRLGEYIYIKEGFNEPVEEGGGDLPYSVDEFEIKDKVLTINGWIGFEKNAEMKKYLLLENIDTGDTYLISSYTVKRPDVTRTFGNGINYDKSGFKINHIDISECLPGEYRASLLYEYDQQYYSTNYEKIFTID